MKIVFSMEKRHSTYQRFGAGLVLLALACGQSLADDVAMTSLPIPYSTMRMINGGDSAAVIAEKASSFHLPLRKTYEGRALAILRPAGDAGKIQLKAEADGLKAATIVVHTR